MSKELEVQISAQSQYAEAMAGAPGSVASRWSKWDTNTKYAVLRSVSHNGSSYVCIKACIGVDPEMDVAAGDGVKGEYWILTAKKGRDGEDGVTPAFTVGTVTTGNPGTQAAATIGGTAAKPVLNLTIPRGDTGGDFLPLAGGTLTGALTLHGDPTEPMHAVSKQYVDEKLQDADFDVTADEVTFADGETFQQKYDNGELNGKSGVYVGSGEMPEGYNVQIDPDGELEPFPVAFVLDTLPEASAALRGSFVIVHDGDTDNLYICMRVGGVYGWIMFNTSDTGGGSEDNAATTSVLGQATLGTMILGG